MRDDFENDLFNAVLDAARGVIREYKDDLDWDEIEFSLPLVFKSFYDNEYTVGWLHKAYMR